MGEGASGQTLVSVSGGETELMMSAFYKTWRSDCQTEIVSVLDMPMFSRDFFVKRVVILIAISDAVPFRELFFQFCTDWR